MSSRARTRSRSASSCVLGTRTACSPSIISSRSSRSASRRSVFTRSLDGRSILPGAAITHSTPAAVSARASANPVGPASYATRVGPGSAAQNATTSRVSPGSRRTRSSPVSRSIVAATTLAR